MKRNTLHKRGFVDPLILLIAILPVYVAELGIDAFHAIRAVEVDEFDYEGEVRRIALAQFDGDESRIAAAQQAWHDLNDAAELHSKLLESFDDPEKDEGWYLTGHGYGVILYPDDILSEIEETYKNNTKERKRQAIRDVERQREIAVEAIQSFEELGIKKLLQRAAEADASYMEQLDVNDNMMYVSLGSDQRSLWRGLNAAKVYARQQGDWDGYIEYHRLSLALARHWVQQPDTLAWLTGASILSGSKEDLREQLSLGAIPAPIIRKLGGIEREQAYIESTLHVFAEMQLETLEIFDTFYLNGDVALIDEPGKWVNLIALTMPRRDTAERIVNHYFESLLEYASLDIATRRQERDAFASALGIRPSALDAVLYSHVYVSLKSASIGRRLLQVSDKLAMEQMTIDLLLAIELYKAEEGALPMALHELVPDYLDSVPTDPYDPEGGLLRYRLLDEPDEMGRAYILYSVGADGEDNGGHLGEDDWPSQSLRKGYEGTDYIFNNRD